MSRYRLRLTLITDDGTPLYRIQERKERSWFSWSWEEVPSPRMPIERAKAALLQARCNEVEEDET